MTRPLVVLTNPIDPHVAAEPGHAEVRTAPAPDLDSLRREARDAHFLIVRAQLPDDIFVQAPRLRAAVRHGAGLDMIPMAAASRHGVAVANVPGVNAVTVAGQLPVHLCNPEAGAAILARWPSLTKQA